MTADMADRLAEALTRQFNAHVEHDEVRPGRYRFEVFSRHFSTPSRLDRQDQAWAVVDRLLSRDESDDISILLTIGPEDVSQEVVDNMP